MRNLAPEIAGRLWLPALLFTFALAADASAARLRGVATYREPTPLPAEATFEALLQDITRPGAEPVTIARARIAKPPAHYIPFEIVYDPRRIQARRSYAVRARISLGDRVLFASEIERVLTRGAGDDVSLELRPAGLASDPELGQQGTLENLPARFTGLLPCRDCAGIREQLLLLPDGSYQLARTFLRTGHDETYYDLGSWTVSSDRRRLVLRGIKDEPEVLAIRNDATLRRLDARGRDPDEPGRHDLHRATEPEPMEPRLPLRGTYRHAENGGTFRDCLTGQSWPIVPPGPDSPLPTAYLEARRRTGGEVFAHIEGRLVMRTRADGARERGLVVERVIGFKPGERCGTVLVAAPLENTRWRLASLGDSAVSAAEGREPWLTLDPKASRASGSGGCNRFSGRFELTGEQALQFGPLTSTKMACPGRDDLERAFLDALARTRGYVVFGRSLELRDESGAVLARLEATDGRQSR